MLLLARSGSWHLHHQGCLLALDALELHLSSLGLDGLALLAELLDALLLLPALFLGLVEGLDARRGRCHAASYDDLFAVMAATTGAETPLLFHSRLCPRSLRSRHL